MIQLIMPHQVEMNNNPPVVLSFDQMLEFRHLSRRRMHQHCEMDINTTLDVGCQFRGSLC